MRDSKINIIQHLVLFVGDSFNILELNNIMEDINLQRSENKVNLALECVIPSIRRVPSEV